MSPTRGWYCKCSTPGIACGAFVSICDIKVGFPLHTLDYGLGIADKVSEGLSGVGGPMFLVNSYN